MVFKKKKKQYRVSFIPVTFNLSPISTLKFSTKRLPFFTKLPQQSLLYIPSLIFPRDPPLKNGFKLSDEKAKLLVNSRSNRSSNLNPSPKWIQFLAFFFDNSLSSEDQPFSFPFSVSCLVAKCEAWNIKMKERQPWYVHVWAVYINTNASRSLGESFSCFCISVSLKNGWEKWFTERKVGVEKRELLKEHRPG